MSEYPIVKITTKNGLTNAYINEFRVPCVTGIQANWDHEGRIGTVRISMMGNIEVDAESNVTLGVNERR